MDGTIEHEINEEYQLVISRWHGTVSSATFRQSYAGLYSDPSYVAGFNELADLRTADMARITTDDLRFVARLTEGFPLFKSAIISASDLNFGVGRMYEALAEGSEHAQVFRDPREAVNWLGVPLRLLEVE